MPGIWMIYVCIEKRHLSFYSDTMSEYVLDMECQIYLTQLGALLNTAHGMYELHLR